MSWETVNLAIRFWSPEDTWGLDPNTSPNSQVPFTPDDQNQIRTLLQQLYVGSSYAQALLEGGASGGGYISFVQTPPGVPGLAAPSSGIAGVNLSAFSHAYMLNSTAACKPFFQGGRS
jgi:hypothetical protein